MTGIVGLWTSLRSNFVVVNMALGGWGGHFLGSSRWIVTLRVDHAQKQMYLIQ